MPAAATRTKHEAYCPHCFLLVEKEVKGEWPEHPVRCPHCRLLIGPGRGRETPEANPGARGSAARSSPPTTESGGAGDPFARGVRLALRQLTQARGDLGRRLERRHVAAARNLPDQLGGPSRREVLRIEVPLAVLSLLADASRRPLGLYATE